MKKSNSHKVAVVSIAPYPFLPAKIGGQRGIALFNKYYSRHVTLTCISVKQNDASLASGYTLMRLLSNHRCRYINPLLLLTVRKVLQKQNARYLLLEHSYYYGWLAILLKWFTGLSFIVHSHNIEALRFRSLGKWWWRLMQWYEKAVHRSAGFNYFIHEADMHYAIHHYGLNPERCLRVSYGTEQQAPPSGEEVMKARRYIKNTLGLHEEDKVILFTGSFNYLPNVEALHLIQTKINPLLISQKDLRYKIVVCGPWMPQTIKPAPNVIFTGFVENIELFYQGADVLLNPVVGGGGIKTKVVEALGYNLNVVSTASGAAGIDPELCNGKLMVVKDNNWEGFARQVGIACFLKADIPSTYFQQFYWDHIVRKATDGEVWKVLEKRKGQH